MTTALPWIGSPRCEWTPRKAHTVCGELATWHITTHDFTHQPPGADPNARRLWLLCADCALAVLTWAKTGHDAGDGFMCRGCNTLIKPALGGFVISHGELAHPKHDVDYE